MADDYIQMEKTKKFLKHLPAYKQALTIYQNEALIHAAKQHMGYDGTKKFSDFVENDFDMTKWKDSKFQRKFAESMSDFYVAKGLQEDVFKEGKDAKTLREGNAEQKRLYNMLSQHYGGITREQLQSQIAERGEEFVNWYFTQAAPYFAGQISDQIRDAAVGHIENKKEHLEQIVNETVAPEIKDKYFARMPTKEEAIELLERYSTKTKEGKLDLDEIKNLRFVNIEKKDDK